MYSETHFSKTALRSAVLLALGLHGAGLVLPGSIAHAAEQGCTDQNESQLITDHGNFTMLTSGGGTVGGTNNVAMTWKGTVFTASSDYLGPDNPAQANVSAASTTPFFGTTVAETWTAHDIQAFAPGSYTFDVTLGGGNPEGTGTNSGAQFLNVTVPAGSIGIHMLFDWNGNLNIDVFVVANPSGVVFGAGLVRSTQTGLTPSFGAYNKCDAAEVINCLWDGPTNVTGFKPTTNQTWMLASTDGNGNSVMGVPMAAGGPFAGFNANFNFNFAAMTFTPGTPCNPTADTAPDQFTFADVPSGATAGAVYSADAMFPGSSTLVSGIGAGETATVQITVGEYSKDGGTNWTSADGTAQNGDTFKVRQTAAATEDGTKTDTTLNIGGVFDVFSVTTVDKKPNAFSFTDQTGVAINTPVESNAITVAGMDAGLSTPISISAGATYTKNGGGPTSAAGTVQNGDVIKVQLTSSASEATTTIATLTLGSDGNGTLVSGTFTVSTAGGVTSTGNNFTMLDKSGSNNPGGTNAVVMFWDQQYNTDENDAVTAATAHMRLSSDTAFFQNKWTAHHIRVFQPGTYVINVECSVAQLETANGCQPNGDARKNYTFTVGANQIGTHMLFDWNDSSNIDVVNVWDRGAVFGPSELFTGLDGFNASTTVWDLMSSDSDVLCPGAVDEIGNPINCGANGINGIPMIDGPFKGFSANFNINFTGTLAPGSYTPTVNVDDPSADTGCSISTKPVSVMERGDWWLVAGFLAWLGALRMRFKRQAQS